MVEEGHSDSAEDTGEATRGRVDRYLEGREATKQEDAEAVRARRARQPKFCVHCSQEYPHTCAACARSWNHVCGQVLECTACHYLPGSGTVRRDIDSFSDWALLLKGWTRENCLYPILFVVGLVVALFASVAAVWFWTNL